MTFLETNFNTIGVAIIVLLAAAFIARKIWKSVQLARTAKSGCSGCGCGTESPTKTDWAKS